MDGFRALAHIENGEGELISRNGNTFRGFADLATWIASYVGLKVRYSTARLLASMRSRPNFRDLLFRRRQCVFIAFDLLFLNGQDLRTLPLLERKAALKMPMGEPHCLKCSRNEIRRDVLMKQITHAIHEDAPGLLPFQRECQLVGV